MDGYYAFRLLLNIAPFPNYSYFSPFLFEKRSTTFEVGTNVGLLRIFFGMVPIHLSASTDSCAIAGHGRQKMTSRSFIFSSLTTFDI